MGEDLCCRSLRWVGKQFPSLDSSIMSCAAPIASAYAKISFTFSLTCWLRGRLQVSHRRFQVHMSQPLLHCAQIDASPQTPRCERLRGKSRLQLLSAFDIHVFRFFANFSGIGISRSLYAFGVQPRSGLWLTRTTEAAQFTSERPV
jgi:hypothetical protein